MLNQYVCGPQGAAVEKTREQRLSMAIAEIHEAIKPWGDGDHAMIIRRILDRNGA